MSTAFHRSSLRATIPLMLAGLVFAGTAGRAGAQPAPEIEAKIDWTKVIQVSRSTPTLQVVVNPQLRRDAKLHDPAFQALRTLGADYVRYVPWLPYPRLAVAELKAPEDGKTFWDFTAIDPMTEDFFNATEGHSVILNFSTIPAWMLKTDKPVPYADDANALQWSYTRGTEFRDPSLKEVAEYYGRLLSWYTRGGFTDEAGKVHTSGHHYKIACWEVMNEIDLEHHWTPEQYTALYDAIVLKLRSIDPDLKFMALALSTPRDPTVFEYFLDPAHHRAGVPIDFISYHFYAQPTAGQGLDAWQYTFFDQADGFLNQVRYVESIRKRLSPATKVDLDELGAILTEDGMENDKPEYVGKPEPAAYWNLASAMYAYLYVELASQGIDVVGESQLVGYHSQFPSVTMINYNTGAPNARFWTLKLLKDHFGPGDKLVETTTKGHDVTVQGFDTKTGKVLLVINKRNRPLSVAVPAGARSIAFVAPSTLDGPATESKMSGSVLDLEPFEVAVVSYKTQ